MRRDFDVPPSVDLTDTCLAGANLRGANLRNVNFYRSNLSHTIFDGAHTDGGPVNFESVSIGYANFADADLRGAVFRNANVILSKIIKTDLSGVIFEHSKVVGVILSLSNVRGSLYIIATSAGPTLAQYRP
ncbi:pentapeptide repeat-containing protein [Nocardia sp. CA-135398]|uniref:pentapeptide repeat-containing protein n=1 Tax=Nocardia sp. CA-135398 TaxID=3239977 RepID=UPI003D97598D